MSIQDPRQTKALAMAAARRRLARLKLVAVSTSVMTFGGITAGIALRTTTGTAAATTLTAATTTTTAATAAPATTVATTTAAPIAVTAAATPTPTRIVSAQS